LGEAASWLHGYDSKVLKQVEIEVKYQGYIERELRRAETFAQSENKPIPSWLGYRDVVGLSHEATEKLSRVQPRSIGQAARVPGITPADVSSILIHLEKRARMVRTRER
jgi:tRNA uridine 5-carboxymethylaminomethyl modification enzyme